MLPNYAVHDQNQLVHPIDLESSSNVENVTDEHNQNVVADENISSSHTSDICNTFDYDSDSNNNNCASNTRKMPNDKDIGNPCNDNENLDNDEKNKNTDVTNITSVIKSNVDSFPPRTSVLSKVETNDPEKKNQYLLESSDDSKTKVNDNIVSMSNDSKNIAQEDDENNKTNNDCNKNGKDIEGIATHSFKLSCDTSTAASVDESTASATDKPTKDVTLETSLGRENHDTLEQSNETSGESNMIKGTTNAGDNSANNVNRNTFKEMSYNVDSNTNNNNNNDNSNDVNNCVNSLSNEDDKRREAPSNHNEKSFCDDKNTNNCNPSNINYSYTNNINNSSNNTNGSSGNDGDKYNNVNNNNNNSNNSGKNDICYNNSNDKKDEDVREINNIKDIRKNVDSSVPLSNDDSYVCNVNVPPNNIVVNSENPHVNSNYVNNKNNNEKVRNNNDNYVHNSNSNSNLIYNNSRRQSDCNLNAVGDVENRISKVSNNEGENNNIKNYGTNICKTDSNVANTVSSAATYCSRSMENAITAVNLNFNHISRTAYKTNNDIDSNNNNNNNENNINVDASNNSKKNVANYNPESKYSENKNSSNNDRSHELKNESYSSDYRFGAKQMLYNNKGHIYPLDASEKYGITDRDSPVFYTTQQSIVASTITRMYGGAGSNEKSVYPFHRPPNNLNQSSEVNPASGLQNNYSRSLPYSKDKVNSTPSGTDKTYKIQNETKVQDMTANNSLDRFPSESSKRNSVVNEKQAMNLSQYTSYTSSHRQQGGDVSSKHIPGAQPAVVDNGTRNLYGRDSYSSYSDTYMQSSKDYQRTPAQANSASNVKYKPSNPEAKYADPMQSKSTYSSSTESLNNYVSHVTRTEKASSGYGYAGDYYSKSVNQYPVEPLRRSHSDIQIDYNNAKNKSKVSPAQSLTQLHMKPPDFSKMQTEVLSKGQVAPKRGSTISVHELTRRNSSELRYQESMARTGSLSDQRHHVSEQHTSLPARTPYETHHLYAKPPNFKQLEEMRFVGPTNSVVKQVERVSASNPTQCCPPTSRQYEQKHPQLSSDVVMSIVPTSRPTENFAQAHSFRYPVAPLDSRRMPADPVNTSTGARRQSFERGNVQAVYVDQTNRLKNVYDDKRTVDRRLPPHNNDVCCVKEPVSSQRQSQQMVYNSNENLRAGVISGEHPAKMIENKMYKNVSQEAHYMRNSEMNAYHRPEQTYPPTNPMMMKSSISNQSQSREYITSPQMESENSLQKQRQPKQVFLTRRTEDTYESWPHQTPPHPTRRHSNAGSPYDQYQPGSHNISSSYSTQPSPTHMQGIVKHSPSPVQSVQMPSSPIEVHNRPSPCANVNYNCTRGSPLEQSAYQTPYKNGPYPSEPIKTSTSFNNDRRSKEMSYTLPHNLKNEQNHAPPPTYIKETIQYKKIEPTESVDRRYSSTTSQNPIVDTVNRTAYSRSIKPEPKQDKRPNYRDMLNNALRNATSEDDLNYRIIKRTLNRDIPIPNTDTDLRKNIFDFPATGSQSSTKKTKAEPVFYNANLKEQSWGPDLQVRRSSVELRQSEWQSNEAKFPVADPSSSQRNLPTNREFIRNDISVTITKVPGTVADSKRNYQPKEMPRNSTCSNSTVQRPILPDVKIEPSKPRMQIVAPESSINSTSLPLDATIKRESPLDLSVKTVKTKADSTGVGDNYKGLKSRIPLPKFEFSPNFSKHAEKVTPDCASNFFTRASGLAPDCEITPSRAPSNYRRSSHDFPPRDYRIPDSIRRETLPHKANISNNNYVQSQILEKRQTNPIPERYLHKVANRMPHEISNKLPEISPKIVKSIAEAPVIRSSESINKSMALYSGKPPYSNRINEVDKCDPMMNRIKYNKSESPRIASFGSNEASSPCSTIMSHERHFDMRIPPNNAICSNIPARTKDTSCIACVPCTGCNGKTCNKTKPMPTEPCRAECCLRTCNTYEYDPYNRNVRDVSTKNVADEPSLYYSSSTEKPYCRDYPSKASVIENDVTVTKKEPIHLLHYPDVSKDVVPYDNIPCKIYVKDEPVEKKMIDPVCLSIKEQVRSPDILLGHSTAPYGPSIPYPGKLIDASMKTKDCSLLNDKIEYEAQSFTPPKVFKVEDANRKSAIQFCPQSSTVYPKQLNTPAVELDNKHKDSRSNFLQQVTPTAPRGIGADVISKLKNSIEQRGLEKQRNMIMSEAKNESQKEKERATAPDIASIIAARIRTKGELKGYLPIPEATAAEKEKSPIKEVVAVKAEIPPIVNFEDTAEVNNLDLCDWTTTCNDFVEQLQSGTKKRRGKKRRSDRDFQTQPIVVAKKPNNMDGKTVVNRSFDIYSSDSRTENCRSYLDSSSEDDKPLLFFKRGSLTGSPFENDSTTSKEVLSSKFLSFENKDDFERKVESNMLLAMKSVEREKSTKAFREEVQKRFAASRSGTSNVDSEDESIRSHQRRRKFTKKQRQRSSNATHMYDFSDSDSCDVADERISSGSLSIKKDSPQRKRFIIKTSSESDSSKPQKKLPRISFDEERKEEVSNNAPSAKVDSPKNEVLNSSLETDPKAEDEAEKSAELKTLDSALSSPAETDSESTKKKETKEDFAIKPVEKSSKTIKEGKKQICDNVEDQKMTRSKHKKEIEKSLANSKVLRNDKVIHDPFYEKERAQSLDKVVKRCSKEPPKIKCKAIKKDHESKPSEDATGDEKKTTKSNVDTSKEVASSDNLTDREQESLRARLRSRDSKLPNDKTSPTINNQKPGATRTESKDKIQDNNDKLIDLCKRGKVPKVVLNRKDKCFAKNLSLAKQQTETPPKKPELKSFPPGWEMEVYQYKRALKVPPSLISIKGPGHHRVSTSLPDLDSHSSDDTDISSDVNKKSSKGNEASQNTDADRKKAKKSNKIQSVQKEANKETKRKPEMEKEQPEEKVTSIIDVLHQRILRQNKSIKKSKQQTTNPRFIHPPSKETELLQTPDTGRNNAEASCSTNVFDTEILKSRTRTESRIMKNKELIREVFGGDERPASAPPEMQDIKIEPITFDEKYDEYLQKMNVDFGEKIRKNKIPGTNYIIPVIDIKQEKIDDESESTINDSKNEKNEFICSAATVNDMQFIPEPALPEDINAESNKDTFKQILFKKKNRHRPSRRKGSSGFDYIRKKKKPIQQSFNALAIRKRKKPLSIDMFPARNEDDICKEIQKWVLNKSVGQSALHKAARLGYIDVIVYCLERIGMNPDLKDNAGYTPLHEACSKGRLDIARLLLQYGANHSESAASGIRPLHEASESGSLEIVRLLLSYGADPLLTTYSGQTPLMLAETTDMEQFLKNHLEDVQNCGPFKQPWKFEGAWKIFDPHIYGYDTLSGVPNGKETVDKDSSWCKSDSSKINCENKIQDKPSFITDDRKELDSKSKQVTTRNDHDREVENDKILVRDSTVISDKIRISMKCSVMLNSIGSLSCLKKFENNLHTQKYLQHGESNSNANNKICESNASDTDDNMFEFEESEMPLPPVYLLNDEGKEKWILLNDLCNLLKVKSKDTLLKQICPSMPPSTVNKQLLRELKMSDFLEKATCLQLLCAGEKINIRSSKVVLVKYNEKVKNLLGVKSILMQF